MKTELENFENWLIRLGYAESTIKGYVRLLDNFFEYLNQRKPTQKEIENFIKDLHQTKLSRQSIQGHLNVINRYSAFLEKTKKQKLAVNKIIVEKKSAQKKQSLVKKKSNNFFLQLMEIHHKD